MKNDNEMNQFEATLETDKDEEEADSILDHIKPLFDVLDRENDTEIVINEPGEIRTESNQGWKVFKSEDITQEWCQNLTKLVSNRSKQKSGRTNPMFGTALPNGYRIWISTPPSVPAGTTAITIRIPRREKKTVQDFIDQGAFKNTRHEQSILLSEQERETLEGGLPALDKELLQLLRNKEYLKFFTTATKKKKSQMLSGSTGSGKTTFANALIDLLPRDERIITAEDSAEILLPEGMNKVSHFYSKDGKGGVSAQDVFEATLRERPDRVFPAELRGNEAFFFIQNVANSGHPGWISTGHANSSKLMFLRLSLMIKTSPAGAGLDRKDILEMLYSLVDIVVQLVRNEDGTREITEIYYDPAFARKQMG